MIQKQHCVLGAICLGDITGWPFTAHSIVGSPLPSWRPGAVLGHKTREPGLLFAADQVRRQLLAAHIDSVRHGTLATRSARSSCNACHDAGQGIASLHLRITKITSRRHKPAKPGSWDECNAFASSRSNLPCRSQAAFNPECSKELKYLQHWLGYREARAAKSSTVCCAARVCTVPYTYEGIPSISLVFYPRTIAAESSITPCMILYSKPYPYLKHTSHAGLR